MVKAGAAGRFRLFRVFGGGWMSLQKGGNTVVPFTELRVALGWRNGPATPGASALIVLLSGRRVRSDGDLLLPGAADGAGWLDAAGGVTYQGRQNRGHGEREELTVDLAALPAEVDCVRMGLRSEGPGFGAFAGLHVQLNESADGTRVARYDCQDAGTETVLILGEFYRRGEEWKFRAVGQGYADGLSGLAADIGMSEESAAAWAGASEAGGPSAVTPLSGPAVRVPGPRAVVALPGERSPAVLPGTAGRAAGGGNGSGGGGGDGGGGGGAGGSRSRYTGYLPSPQNGAPELIVPPHGYELLPWQSGPHGQPGRLGGAGAAAAVDGQPQVIVLTPTAPGISLTKQGATRGTLRINLNWSMLRRGRQQPQGGFLQWLFGGEAREPELDLDLCCLWELQDGRKGVIQPTGNRFGALHRPPYIRLDKDDRTGGTEDGENIDVNLDHSADFRRLLIFSVIYEGATGYGGMDASARLYLPYGAPIEVRLDQTEEMTRMCAIALIENVGGELVVRREGRYIPGNEADVDRAYNWGLRWSRGYK